jgi:formylglycine-generating enzyme required for sulfatase activity/dienelactone hydrolase
MRCLAKRPEDRPQHAEAVLAELDALISTSKPVGARVTPRQQIVMLAFGLILVGSIGWAWKQSSDRAWVSSEAIPELQRLVDAENFRAAAILAAKAVKLAPGDTALASLEKRIIEPVSVTTTPSGAEVFERGYSDTAAAWTRLGTTPLAEAMLPRGIKRLRISLAGHDTLESAVQSGALSYTLTLSDTAHAGMVRIPAGTTRAWIAGLDPIEREGLGAYFIDRYEVTNEDFRKFVDAGGYTRRELWKFPITKDGRAIDWQAAVREFVDATGQPGPSTWELGNYAKGQDRHPVSGVSWFEAAAYAEYAGKSLPTVYHWVHAASTSIPQVMIPLSNFSGLGKVAVGRNQGMSAFGVYDMAGNVREWQYNPSGALRHALGGASTDPAYMFTFASTRDPFERSSDLGFRCAKYDGGGSGAAARNLDLSHRDYSKERPVADAVFRVFLNQFSYDQAPLDARVESDSALADYRHQVITFNAAYGGERVIAHLYLPKSGRPPYQTVVYYPGSTAIGEKRFVNDGPMWLAEGGRAVVFPIYKSTYERNDGLTSTWANPTHRHTEAVVRQVKDFKRTVDYLATRSDFDVEKLAYFGNSWGARMGTIIPAVDTRIKTAILAYGGLSSGHSLPEVDQINYAGHITVPVLMLNGRFDAIEPYESAQLPLFRLLGASPVRKRHVVWDVAHGGAPVNAFRKEVLDWLDRYLGTPSR